MIALRVALSLALLPLAQSPTGTIVGRVTDASGAVLPGAAITIVDDATGSSRDVVSSSDGAYAAPALPPGRYTVTARLAGFKRVDAGATIAAGTTTTVDVILEIGAVTESITVAAVAPLVSKQDHQVTGLVTRPQIDALPLNGRNFLDLAKLEPGIANATRGTNNRVFVPMLGTGLQTQPRVGSTRITVDGANVGGVGIIGAALQVSQDVVQEFQIATLNFDAATSLTTNGAINIVTQSGSNDAHGNGFFAYRDHHLAAYPALGRDPSNADPFFRRRQFGGTAGGPLVHRAFFFASVERNLQDGVISVQPSTPEFAALSGIFASPYADTQLSARADARIRSGWNAFIRETFETNHGFAPLNAATNVLPSGWTLTTNRVNQALASVTAVLSPSVVNELRASHFYMNSPEQPADSSDCAGCVGLGAPRVSIPDAGNLALGQARTLTFVGRRRQVTDRVTWQRGAHQLVGGIDWEHGTASGSTVTADSIMLWSPNRLRQADIGLQLPSRFRSLDDILRLPLQTFQTTVGPAEGLYRDFGSARILNLFRTHVADTWRIHPRVSFDVGLAWSYEPHTLNDDLTKPTLLALLLGPDGLRPPGSVSSSFAPAAGLAWTIGREGRTVVRVGAGRYVDPMTNTNPVDLGGERAALSPLGTGRLTRSGSNVVWEGQTLNFSQPTPFSGATLVAALPAIRDSLLALLNPTNRDFSIRNIDQTKEAVAPNSILFDPAFRSTTATHVAVGVQRQLGADIALSVDVTWRRFDHTVLSGIDYNHFTANGPPPAIPKCSGAQQDDVQAQCSNGPIVFDNSAGHATDRALLVRLDKRFAGRSQLLVSYALGSYTGTNGPGVGTGFDNTAWFTNTGPLPTDQRHILNVSGFIELPARLRAAMSLSAYSAPPLSAYVSAVDFNGDGTTSDLLPGTTVNAFGRGLDANDLRRLVDQYNRQVAGKRTIGGQLAPTIALPDTFAFNDSFFAVDARLSRSIGGLRRHIELLLDIFNVFNTANLLDFNGNLANTATFGQPGSRVSQVFGSGGPRAVQIGARATF